jgi:hypothetical protein
MWLVPVSVLHDSVCYDTLPVGVEDRRGTVPRPAALRALGLTSGRLELTLEHAARISVRLFSTDGRMLSVLAQGEMLAGRHELAMPARLAAGTYIVRAEADGETMTAKAIVHN